MDKCPQGICRDRRSRCGSVMLCKAPSGRGLSAEPTGGESGSQNKRCAKLPKPPSPTERMTTQERAPVRIPYLKNISPSPFGCYISLRLGHTRGLTTRSCHYSRPSHRFATPYTREAARPSTLIILFRQILRSAPLLPRMTAGEPPKRAKPWRIGLLPQA